MSKEVILFDIDKTLFNTKALENISYAEMAEITNKTVEDIESLDNDYVSKLEISTDFYPKDYIKHLSNKLGLSIEVLEKIFYKNEIYEQSLFEETKITLEKLSKNYILGIYSEGFIDYQTCKLELSKIIDFFDPKHVFIERRKLNEDVIKKLPQNSVVIDDKEEVIEKLFESKRVNPIWINRIDERKNKNVATINCLTDLLERFGIAVV